jgi:hypothetical protein
MGSTFYFDLEVQTNNEPTKKRNLKPILMPAMVVEKSLNNKKLKL